MTFNMTLFKHLHFEGNTLIADRSIAEIHDFRKGGDVVHRVRMLVEASVDLFVGDYPLVTSEPLHHGTAFRFSE